MRTTTLTPDDLAEMQSALDALAAADTALRDLRDRMQRTNDELRSGRLRVAIGRLGEARTITELAFR